MELKIKEINNIDNKKGNDKIDIDKNKNEIIQKYINQNSKNIYNNSLYKFFEDKSYENIPYNELKEEIFYFTSFINSCKDYKDINELKKDIKIFFKNKNENTECHLYIINNFLQKLFNIISNNEFFNDLNNIKQLIKILRRFEKNLNLNIADRKYSSIHQNIIYLFDLILEALENNYNNEKIKKYIKELTNKINYYKSCFHNMNPKTENNNKIIYSGVKENKNININLTEKEKSNEIFIKKNNEDILDNYKNSKQIANISTNNKKKDRSINNYENLKFIPFQNDKDN